MIDKGILVIFAIGAAFIYFALNMFNMSSNSTSQEWSPRVENAPYARYYKKDVLGNDVLDLSSLPLEKAKKVWPTTPTKEHIADEFPDFSLAKAEVKNLIHDGEFKQFLLRYLEKLEGKYFGGELSLEQVKAALSTLK